MEFWLFVKGSLLTSTHNSFCLAAIELTLDRHAVQEPSP
jgi:hypothetical protein